MTTAPDRDEVMISRVSREVKDAAADVETEYNEYKALMARFKLPAQTLKDMVADLDAGEEEDDDVAADGDDELSDGDDEDSE